MSMLQTLENDIENRIELYKEEMKKKRTMLRKLINKEKQKGK